MTIILSALRDRGADFGSSLSWRLCVMAVVIRHIEGKRYGSQCDKPFVQKV